MLDYQEESLKLLALRHNSTGIYLPYRVMKTHAGEAGIPVVSVWAPDESSQAVTGDEGLLSALTKLRDAKDVEGFVLRFDSGRMFKVRLTGRSLSSWLLLQFADRF